MGLPLMGCCALEGKQAGFAALLGINSIIRCPESPWTRSCFQYWSSLQRMLSQLSHAEPGGSTLTPTFTLFLSLNPFGSTDGLNVSLNCNTAAAHNQNWHLSVLLQVTGVCGETNRVSAKGNRHATRHMKKFTSSCSDCVWFALNEIKTLHSLWTSGRVLNRMKILEKKAFLLLTFTYM